MIPNKGVQAQNQRVARIVRDMSDDEFRQVLESLSQQDADRVAALLHKRLARRGQRETSAAALRKKLLFSTKNLGPFSFADIVGQQMYERSEEILGDSFEDPSAQEVSMLTVELTTEFGFPRTRIWFGQLVAIGVTASAHIEAIARETPGLNLSPNLTEDVHDAPVTRPDQGLRESRRARRQHEREQREKKRRSDESSRQNNKKFNERSSHDPSELPVPEERSQTPDFVTNNHRIFPHLGRYPKADPHHDLVGAVIVTWIRFTTEPDTGKSRPCVILAVEPRRLVVKPLYSEPRFGAGFWRAVEIIDWSKAGLKNKSWAGDEIHTVRRRHDTIGRLSENDWNRICLGESNSGQ
jgi:hypothetical protein